MIPMQKVVTVQEMRAIEDGDKSEGKDEKQFMINAGRQIAMEAKEQIGEKKGSSIVICMGKGNKGGDGYVAAMELLQEGFSVTIYALYPLSECSKLNQFFAEEFQKMGGKIQVIARREELDFSRADLIIDALLGTGFYGDVKGLLQEAIDQINSSQKKVLSIDIPSGLNGTSGIKANSSVIASSTVTLGFAKTGFFLHDGWNCIGNLQVKEFGLSQKAIEKANPTFLIPDFSQMALPRMARKQHKYERGFVIGFGGSAAMKGAVKLSGSAAIHAGAGIVKIFSVDEIGPAINELICQTFDFALWNEAVEKADTVFVGPGLGRASSMRMRLEDLFSNLKKPCVIDADALFFLPKIDTWPETCVLTPHRGEMMHLLGLEKVEDESEFLKQCQTFIDLKKVHLILKGAPTFILSPNQLPIVIPKGDPGMATAGSGDVLTGILAALLAQKIPILDACIFAVSLHAFSGEAAAKEKTSYGYTAEDLISFLPKAFSFFCK